MDNVIDFRRSRDNLIAKKLNNPMYNWKRFNMERIPTVEELESYIRQNSNGKLEYLDSFFQNLSLSEVLDKEVDTSIFYLQQPKIGFLLTGEGCSTNKEMRESASTYGLENIDLRFLPLIAGEFLKSELQYLSISAEPVKIKVVQGLRVYSLELGITLSKNKDNSLNIAFSDFRDNCMNLGSEFVFKKKS
jgi:hypothetical protein